MCKQMFSKKNQCADCPMTKSFNNSKIFSLMLLKSKKIMVKTKKKKSGNMEMNMKLNLMDQRNQVVQMMQNKSEMQKVKPLLLNLMEIKFRKKKKLTLRTKKKVKKKIQEIPEKGMNGQVTLIAKADKYGEKKVQIMIGITKKIKKPMNEEKHLFLNL